LLESFDKRHQRIFCAADLDVYFSILAPLILLAIDALYVIDKMIVVIFQPAKQDTPGAQPCNLRLLPLAAGTIPSCRCCRPTTIQVEHRCSKSGQKRFGLIAPAAVAHVSNLSKLAIR